MIRKAFVMAVSPGKAEEYARRHMAVWPELESELRAHGAKNYSIFYHPSTRQLFAYVELKDEQRWRSLAEADVCRRWWQYMADIMPTNEDGSPVSASLSEVYHLS